ncbi:MAG: DUF4185 domain-containing protein [Myxococcota bacterium]
MIAVVLVACRSPSVEVLAVDDRGPLATTPAIQGRDGGYSTRMGDLSVWAHGDTILAQEGEHGSWLNNTVSWTADLDASDGIDGFEQDLDGLGVPASFFPPADDVIWAGALVADPVRGGVLVSWIRIPEAGEERTGLSHWAGPGTLPDVPGDGLFGPEVRVASTLIADGDQLYGFGCQSRGFDKPCTLARSAFDDALSPSGWAFWDGSAWSDTPGDAKPLFDAHDILTVHFSEPAGLWMAVYSEPLGDRVYARTSEALTGPWSAPVELFEAEPSDDGTAPYSAVAHAEYTTATSDGWTEVVTYHRGTEPWHSELREVHVTLRSR